MNFYKYLAAQNNTNMNHLLLNAFYDNVDRNIGPTLIWVFFFLMIIEILYVSFKYVKN